MPSAGLADQLAHVLWIGGAPVAGKTSVCDALAWKHGLQTYDFDGTSAAHTARVNANDHPALAAFIAMSMDERWLLRSPEVMATTMIQNWTERFSMVVDDLLAMPRQPRIIAEGNALFPECVAPLLTTPRQAVWLVPAPGFIASRHLAIEAGRTDFLSRTSDPERALAKLVERNELLAAHIRRKAAELGLTSITVDGETSLADTCALVDRHFGLDSEG